MANRQKRGRLIVILSAVAVIALIAATYFGAYLSLGADFTYEDKPDVRVYEHDWQASLFHPAALLESLINGKEVETSYYRRY